jgi:hypothetical protein
MDGSIAHLLVGRTLVGRYEIEEVIGRGGMSVVYRAADRRLGRPVAVKIISIPEHGAEEQAELRERLRREAASAARIPPHPNVVQIYDYGTDPELGVDFIAMELLRGDDLKRLMSSGAPPVAEALRLLEGAARGVAAGHRAGIVHRDLKPSNIIIVDDGDTRTVKIVDFGIAKALRVAEGDDLTRTGHVPLSPAYASPEQMRHGAPLTTASDVYQLGLIGYELLSGERPFSAAEHERIKAGESIVLPERGRWPEIPETIRRVVDRALCASTEDRYADAGEFVAALTSGDDATVLETSGGAPPAPGVPVSVPRRVAVPGVARGLHLPRNALLGAAGLLALLLVWLATRGGGASAPAAPAPVAAADSSSIDAEFRTLQLAAYENLAEHTAADEAAAAVGRVLEDLTDALVKGEIERHIAHYADEVRFYGRRRERSDVARSRARLISDYPERTVTFDRTAINLPEAGRAEVLVDKSWDFGGEDERWTGASRTEYTLELRGGEWLVIGERDVEVFRDDHDDS